MVGPSRVPGRHVKKDMPMRRERNAKEQRTRKAPPPKRREGDYIEDFYLDSFYGLKPEEGDAA